jgi:hypothetical protein
MTAAMQSAAPGRPVSQRQNAPDMVDLVCASSHHYRRAKQWRRLRVAGTIGLALLAPVITFWAPSIGPAVATAAGIWLFLARILIARLEDKQMQYAVTAQEQFDTELFALPWHHALAGKPLAHQDVTDAARHIDEEARATKKDWYPNADAAAWPLNVVLCQQASAIWSRRSHGQYAEVLRGMVIAWFIAGVIMGWADGVSLAAYLVQLFLPSMPAFLDALELADAHQKASERKEKIEGMTSVLWARGLVDPASVTTEEVRQVQDHSYRQRRDNPQVAEWHYQLHRKHEENAMRQATQRRLDELKQAGWLQGH